MPENQREPFYRDHEGQDHLKPQVRQFLSNFFVLSILSQFLGKFSVKSSIFRSNSIQTPFFTPFYLQIVVGLGNASIYCQTLSNLYSDPNYQSLNHWSILQTLTRKGVPIAESPDMPLTETVLIQTNPLRIVSVYK